MDRRIRRYIRAKKKLIELLNEQKQAIINCAVTRGLDPNVRLQPSGVEWLGDVPEHWVLVPNRALLRIKKDVVGSDSGDYTLLSLTKRGVIPRDLENPEGKFPTSFDTYQAVEPGDLIFCLFDIDETPRAVGLAMMAGMVTGAYTMFACADPAAVEFVYLLYLAMDNGKHLKPLYTGLRKVITKSTFLSAKMPLPPPPERRAIVDHVRTATRQADNAIERAEREISLLREYRTRLFADVVTGKLDVREAAEKLPDRPEELEAFEDAETTESDDTADEAEISAVVETGEDN
jgi:type I restriction enzyme S subunit